MIPSSPAWLLLLGLLASACRASPAHGPRLVHAVYFDLVQDSPRARSELIEDCRAMLAGQPGVLELAAGERAAELARPVNDQGYDVALVVVFESLAAHDAYQASPAHEALVAKHGPTFASVRVFDSWVSGL